MMNDSILLSDSIAETICVIIRTASRGEEVLSHECTLSKSDFLHFHYNVICSVFFSTSYTLTMFGWTNCVADFASQLETSITAICMEYK